MNATLVPSMVSSVFMLFIIGGFVFGWFRGLSKSLVRLILVLMVGVLTFFVVPEITQSVLEMDISKLNIVFGDVHVMTVKDFVTDFLRQIPVIEDIIEASPTFEAVIEVAPQILFNVLLFVLMFFIFKWVSMIFYWIIAGVFFSKKKTAGKEKHNFIGAVLGAFQGLIIVFVLFVPFYGVVETVKPISNAMQESAVQSQVATFDADDNDEGETVAVKYVIDDVGEYVSEFDAVWVNKVMNFVGIKKLGVNMFDKLTTVENGTLTLSLMDEVETISDAYPHVRKIVDDGFDATNNEQLDGVKSAINELYGSPVLSNIVKEIIPEVAYRWYNGYDFCGIKKPTVDNEKTQALVDTLLLNLSISEGDDVKTDVDVCIDIVKLANDVELIKSAMDGESILHVLSLDENRNFLSDVLTKALESKTMKAVLPKAVDAGMDIVFGMLGVDRTNIGAITIESDAVDWETEIPKLQTIFNNFIDIYLQIQEGIDEGRTALESLDFKLLGETFDNIRFSVLLGPTSVDIMEALLNTSEIVGDDSETLNTFIEKLKEAWEGTEPLAPIFESLGEALKLAKDLQNGAENFDVDALGDIITNLAGNETFKDVVNEVVKTETLQDMGLNKETADMVEETISSVINADYTEGSGNSLEKEIEAVKEVYNVANQVMNAEEGGKVDVSAEQSEALVGALAESTVLLDKVAQSESSLEQLNIKESLSEEAQGNLKTQIDALNTETLEGKSQEEVDAIKAKLNALFGL